MRPAGLLLPLVLLAAPDEWERDVPNLFEGSWFQTDAGPVTHLVARVVDDLTGEPIAGARLYAQWEEDEALPRLAAPGRVAVSGEDGWLRYALEPCEGNWFYVEAEGYGPWAEMSGLPEEIRLRRGVNLRVRLRDWYGRPVAGASVGYYLGCGHTPDSRQAVTGAEGVAVIPCVDPREGILFPVGEGIEARDWFGCGIPEGDVEMVCSPGQTIEGVLHDAQGAPLVGVLLHGSGWNHGPRARTDAEGRFRLEGVSPDAGVWVYRDAVRLGSFEVHPGERRTVFSLEHASADQRTQMLDLALFEEGAGELEEEVDVVAVHDDGRRFEDQADFRGDVRMTLPPGECTLWIGDRLGVYRRTSVRVVVPRDERPPPMRVRLERNPVVEVDASAVPDGWAVVLACEWEERDVTERAREGRVPVPEGTACALRVVCGERCGGLVRVPADRARVTLPAAPEVGDDEILPTPHDVRVFLPDGAPAEGASATCSTDFAFHMGWVDAAGVAAVGFDGGMLVIDAGEGWLPYREWLSGDGPWTFRLPGGGLEIDVRGPEGEPLDDCVAVIDGEACDGLALRGLAEGAHRVLVAVPGFLAKDCRIVLAAGETRRMVVRLARPRG